MANKINFQVGFSVDKSGLNELQSLLQRISNSANSQLNPGKQISSGLKQAAATANQLDKILEKTFNTDLGTLNVTKFNQELSKSGMTLKSVQSDLSKAGNNGATAYNRLTQAIMGTNMQLKESNKLLDSMATTMMNTVKWGITSSIFNTITNSIQKAYTYSKQLDTSLNNIRIVTGKSADEMDLFAEKANDAAKALGASTLDYTNASLIYYQQGLSDVEAQARAETTVKVANITGQTGSAVSEELTAVWNGYKVSAEETEVYVDKLAAVAATTAADLEELSVGMSKVASAANAMGVDFDDLNAQIATIVSVTRQAPESVGTALKTIYARLGDLKVDGVDEFGVKLGEVSSQLQTMGIEILDANGDMRDMSSVMAEVAEKWDTWTRAQQQAAAVAMAGKRQYNNLVALFENWDMYSEALETSKDSLGTLQEQQDIYMESTAAKLKTLKATWQDLYEDAINKDEINDAIEGLTSLVQVVDHVVDAFGGGANAALAFGTVLVSIFDKQISKYIIQANQQMQTFQQNLDIAKQKEEIMKNAISPLGDNATPQELGALENSRIQAEYAQKIFDVSKGLTQEQYNQLTTYQEELGILKEKETILEAEINNISLKSSNTGEIVNLIKAENVEVQDIKEKWAEIIVAEEDELSVRKGTVDLIKKELISTEELQNKKQSIFNLSEQLGEFTQEEIRKILLEINSNDDLINQKGNIIRLIQQSVTEQDRLVECAKEENALTEKAIQKRAQIVELREKENNITQQTDNLIKMGEAARNTSLSITSLAAPLGTVAMLWGTINSLQKTWDTDTDQSTFDRIRQSLMAIAMLAPSAITLLTKVKDISDGITNSIKTYNAAVEAQNNINAAKNVLLQTTTSNLGKNTIANQVNAMIQDIVNASDEKNLLVEQLQNASTKKRIQILGSLSTQQLTSIGLTKQEAAALIELKTAQEGANAAALANPYILAGAAIVAIVAGLTFATLKYKEAKLKDVAATKEQIRSIREENQAKQEEIDKNVDLYNSYLSLYKQYEQGLASKSDMASKTKELTDVLSEEAIAVAELTGNYDFLAKKIKEARDEELKEKVSSSKETEQNLVDKFKKSNPGIIDSYMTEEKSSLINQSKYFKTYKEGNNNLLGVNTDIENVDLMELYEEIKEIRSSLTDKELKQQFNQYLDDSGINTIIAEMLANRKELEYNETKLEVSELVDLEDVNNYEQFQETLKQVSNILGETSYYGSLSEEALDKASIELIESLTDSNKNYINRYLAIQSVLKEYEEKSTLLSDKDIEEGKKKIQSELESLSDADFNRVIVNLDVKNIDPNDIKTAVELAQQQVDSAELGVVTSLRAKISSDKKLSKTEMKEALGEQETLTSEYEIGLHDWDNQSQLDQVEILNDIVRDKIRINNEYIENIKETARKEVEIEQAKVNRLNANYSEELEQLEKKKEASKYDSSIWTEEDEERYNEITRILDEAGEKVKYWSEVAEKGFAYEDFNSITFDNLISGIDGLISETQVLADLVAKVGENWTIAGKDIEEFALNFPEVLAEQENFNYLQDGSIQLTEAGKKALQENLDAYKEKIILENKAYQEELQRQADIQYITAEMYEAQAKALDDYLAGRKTGKETEATLEKNYTNYKEKLTKQLGISDEKLNNLMRQNGYTTAEEEVANQENIFKGWVSVGEIAAKAGMAYSTKEFNANEVVSPSGKQTAVKVTAAESYNPKTYDAGGFQGLTNEDIAAYRDQLLKQAQAARNQGDIYLSKKLGAGTQTQAMINAMGNAVSGKGNGKSSSKEEKEKEISDEFDRYWEYKKAIDMLDKAMARLEKTQSKLHGKELIDSLKEENKLLEKQKANYEALIQAQEREAGELQGKLNYYGAIFSDNGELANYADLTSNMLSQLTSGQVSEKAYEDFKKALERYDSLYYSEMQDTLDKLDDARRKQLENNLKAWQIDIDIQLDLTKAKRAWNDFVRDLEQDFRKIYSDLTIESAYDTANFDTYVDDLNTTLQAIHDIENEITKLASVGKSDMFESMSDAQEKLKELGEDLIENGKSLYDLYKSVWDNYINKLDQAADNLNDINDEFGHITDELEHEKKLIELIYGDKAYDKMTKFYNAQQKNINLQIDSLKTQKQFWEDQFNAAYMMNKDDHNVILEDMSTWTEDMRKAYDQMIDSQEALNDKIVDGIDNLTNNYLNKLAETFDNLEKAVWNMNLDDMTDDWDRITDLAGEYLDDVEGAYQIQSLANKIDKDINDTNNLKAAQALQAFREKEIAILREKDNLTQDDIDLAEARYQIMLKQIALEDAQNAKTSMKLTRNTSGNWTYQYVADEDDTADKQQELLQAYQNLYTMADNAYQHAMELATGSYQEMQDKIKGIAEDTTLAEEEKMLKIQEIQDTYLPMIEAAVENSELYRQEATTATGAVFEEVCQQDADAYQYLTDLQKELVDEVKDKHLDDYEAIRSAVVDGVYPEIAAAAQNAFLETNLNSSTAAADVIHQWADDDGESVKAKLNEAIDSIEDNVKEFEGELDNMKVIAGEDFTAVDMEIEKTVKWLDTMEDKTEEMATHSSIVLDTMRIAVENLALSFNGVIDKVYEAYNAMADYKEAVGMAIDQMRQFNIVAQEYGGIDLSGLLNNGGNPPATPSTTGKASGYALSPTADNKWIEKVTFTSASGKVYSGTIRTDKSFGGEMTEEMFKQRLEEEYKDNGYISGFDGLIIYDKDTHLPRFATGGYTGDWGNDHGKLAILDSKELVLNETDTSNFLRATNLLRDISKINGSIEDSIMTSILGMMSALSPHIGGFSTGQGKNGTNGNIFNITAEFPNANDVTSIREAILSLPNLASQYVHQSM